MKKQKILKKLISCAGIIFTLAGCTKEGPLPDFKPLGSDPVGIEDDINLTGKTFQINLNECTPLIYFSDNTNYGNYQAVIDITPKFDVWPQAGDKLEITYNDVANEDFPVIYSNIVDTSARANYWTLLGSQTDILFYRNIKKGTTNETKVTFVFAQSPYDNISLQLFYEQSTMNKTASLGSITDFGKDSPEDCEFIYDFKNMDEHPLNITTYLYVDGFYLEVSETKTLLPYTSARFYYDFDKLEKKYSNFYGENVFFLRKIEHPAFTWTDNNRQNLSWNSFYFTGWRNKPSEIRNKKFTDFEHFNYEYNASENTYYHNAPDYPSTGLSEITSEDRQRPDKPFLDTGIAFPHNNNSSLNNYQAYIPLFTDSSLNKGDKIKLTITGIPNDSIKKLYVFIVDNSPQAKNWSYLTDPKIIETIDTLTKDQSFNYEHIFEIVEDSVAVDLSDIKLVLSYPASVLNKETSMEHCTISYEEL